MRNINSKHLNFFHRHRLTVSPSHRLTVSQSHRLTVSPSHSLTVSPSHRLTVSPSHRLTVSPSHRLTVTRPQVNHKPNNNWTAHNNQIALLEYCYCCYYCFNILQFWGRVSSVGIATRYGLDGQGMESRWRRDFPHSSRPALWPSQPPLKWVPGLFTGINGRGLALTSHLHLVPRLKRTFMACCKLNCTFNLPFYMSV